jgi:hypothetical protein
MNNKFDELTKSLAQSVTRRGALKKPASALVGTMVAGLLVLSAGFTASTLSRAAGADTKLQSVVTDPAGDAVFPYKLYDGPVPPYVDVIKASVSLSHGIFHFEIQVNSDIPAIPNPGLTPSVNHFGNLFGIQTDRKTAGHIKFFGQPDNYYFNYVVGVTYSTEDAGPGFRVGWNSFVQGPNGVIDIPLMIRKDTYIFETSAESLGNPTSFDWAIGCECDPVTHGEETFRTVILVEYVPDHGMAHWPQVEP